LDELSNQLTSDEPKENVDASPTMLARQEQLQDAILSASGQMQKESQALLDELRKVSDVITFAVNPLSPNSDKNEISLYNIATCSDIQVMRIKEINHQG